MGLKVSYLRKMTSEFDSFGFHISIVKLSKRSNNSDLNLYRNRALLMRCQCP